MQILDCLTYNMRVRPHNKFSSRCVDVGGSYWEMCSLHVALNWQRYQQNGLTTANFGYRGMSWESGLKSLTLGEATHNLVSKVYHHHVGKIPARLETAGSKKEKTEISTFELLGMSFSTGRCIKAVSESFVVSRNCHEYSYCGGGERTVIKMADDSLHIRDNDLLVFHAHINDGWLRESSSKRGSWIERVAQEVIRIQKEKYPKFRVIEPTFPVF